MNFNDLPADVKQLFDDILKYRIDPAAEHYGVTLDMIAKSFDMIKTDAVHAVDSD